MTDYYKCTGGSCSTSSTGSLGNGSKFFLFLGQSNMVGQGTIDPEIDTGSSGIKMLLPSGVVTLASEPITNNDSQESLRLGMNLAFGRSYVENNPNSTIVIALSAFGSTSFGAGDWIKGGARYDSAIATYNRAVASTGLECGGILWHQGESDCTAIYAPMYASRLSQFVSDFRSDINQPNMPFVLGQMSPLYRSGYNNTVNFPLASRVVVNSAHVDAPNQITNCAVVNTDGLADDGTHFYPSGLRTLGERYYTAWASL